MRSETGRWLESSLGFAVKRGPERRVHNGLIPHSMDVGRVRGNRYQEVLMAEAKTSVAHKPVWVDLSTSDAEGARNYYAKLFGWKVEVNPDPQYGGYALAKVSGKDVAGIGPKQMDEAPTAWTVYIGTPNAAETAKKAEAAGAKIIAPVMEVGEQGHMAII